MLHEAERRPASLYADFTMDDLPHSRMQALFKYWLDARRDAAMPPISAIDPLQLPRKPLPFLSMLEVVGAPPRFLIRLLGTQLVEVIGRDLTRRYLDEIEGMDQPVARSQWCLAHGRPYLAEAPLSWSQQHYKTYSSLNLPFGDTTQGVRRIVSVFAFS